MFNRNATRQPDSWSRNVDRQVSLLSRTHLLDMDESNDMMDEVRWFIYRQIVRINLMQLLYFYKLILCRNHNSFNVMVYVFTLLAIGLFSVFCYLIFHLTAVAIEYVRFVCKTQGILVVYNVAW